MSWTEERITLLKQLWADNWSARNIAAELGGVSRNGVIGKLHRMGLTSDDGGSMRMPTGGARTPRKQIPSRNFTFINAKRRRIRLANSPGLAAIPIECADDKARVSLLQLTHLTCRWPVGIPGQEGFGFCGDLIAPGFSYCPGHCARAFTSDREKRGKLRQSAVTGGYA